ncbi:MAG TPA: helix-turn-helix domain-containing protein, partial [Candidatus Cloacimonas sp.]|nr:helix-turn-helix domain-containing protein [Candidatus Cloacimonas sp.]
MIQNLQLIKNQAQLKEMGSPLKYNILKELIKAPATCQQLATLFACSKQKMHYNLTQMLSQGLLKLEDDAYNNNKEVYYRATARSYVLDLAIGLETNGKILDNRNIINSILEQEYHINLNNIAAKLIDEALKLTKGMHLLITTGKFNLPLVEKLLLEAGKRGIYTSLMYQDLEQLQARAEQYSLIAFQADYENFNQKLKEADVYLNLNGESRTIEVNDEEKLHIRSRMLEKGRKIIKEKNIRLAMMPSLLYDTLSEQAIESEAQFWRALDINYQLLSDKTIALCRKFVNKNYVEIETQGEIFQFGINNIWAECGSFGSCEFQSPIINLPGGEILIIPKPDTMQGKIVGDRAYVLGEEILHPVVEIVNNEITVFSAASNQQQLAKAIETGGKDGRKVALICLGTNDNIRGGNIDNALKHKSSGFMSVYWGS